MFIDCTVQSAEAEKKSPLNMQIPKRSLKAFISCLPSNTEMLVNKQSE